MKIGDSIVCIHKDGTRERAAVTKVWEFSGLKSGEIVNGEAGNIVGISGFEELSIGETLCDGEEREPVPWTGLDPPTSIQMPSSPSMMAPSRARMMGNSSPPTSRFAKRLYKGRYVRTFR